MVIPGHNLGNSQVRVYRTIGPTLVEMFDISLIILHALFSAAVPKGFNKLKKATSLKTLDCKPGKVFRNFTKEKNQEHH